jgi:hypothetical protein
MTDLHGLLKYREASDAFVIIPLKGQVKGESHTCHHLLHCVNVTDSGIKVRSWVRRLVAIHLLRGWVEGPAFVDAVSGSQSSSTMDMNNLFIELLVDLYKSQRPLFGVDVYSSANVVDKYHVFWSFRRGSESQAVAKKVDESD